MQCQATWSIFRLAKKSVSPSTGLVTCGVSIVLDTEHTAVQSAHCTAFSTPFLHASILAIPQSGRVSSASFVRSFSVWCSASSFSHLWPCLSISNVFRNACILRVPERHISSTSSKLEKDILWLFTCPKLGYSTMAKSKTRALPLPYPPLPFHVIRGCLLVCSLIVSSILSFFVYHLTRDEFKIPWTFLVVSLICPTQRRFC